MLLSYDVLGWNELSSARRDAAELDWANMSSHLEGLVWNVFNGFGCGWNIWLGLDALSRGRRGWVGFVSVRMGSAWFSSAGLGWA